MLSKFKPVLFLILGILLSLIVFFVWRNFFSKKEETMINDYYVITNQIEKMNKMVVVEQNSSNIQRTTIKSDFLGNRFLPSVEKKIITLTSLNAQVSYNLSQMDIEVDSLTRKMIIKKLPQADIRIIPSVEIQAMDDSFYNRFTDKDIKKITQKAKEEAMSKVDREKLVKEGKKHLLENLNEIFVLAKSLHYQIIDDTNSIDINKL